MPEQYSLFSAAPSAPAPVFGVQASWLCFGRGLGAALERRYAEGGREEACELAEVAYLYLNVAVGPVRSTRPSRIQCPALNFDRTGDYRAIHAEFFQAAVRDVIRRFGFPEMAEEKCTTTAWRGETRIMAGTLVELTEEMRLSA